MEVRMKIRMKMRIKMRMRKTLGWMRIIDTNIKSMLR
jgi:hypothetical protein